MARFLPPLFALGAVFAACTSDITVFDESGTGDGGEAGSTAVVGGAGGDETTSVAVTTSSSVTTSGTTSTTTTTTTATSSVSTTTGVPMSSIPCGNETCMGVEVCCVHEQLALQDHCGPPGSCGDDYIEVGCNGPNDCLPTEVCCGFWSQQTGYAGVSCELSCSDSGGYTAILMCGDDPSVCEPGDQCNPSSWLPQGHAYCG